MSTTLTPPTSPTSPATSQPVGDSGPCPPTDPHQRLAGATRLGDQTAADTPPRGGGLVVRWARRHPLAAYGLVAYTLSWGYWIPLVLTGHVVRFGQATTHFPALLGPAIAAVALTATTDGRRGVRDLLARTLRWRVAPRRWLFAIGSPLLLVALALAVLAAGPGLPDLTLFGRTAGLPDHGVLFGWAMLVLGGLGEEVGWRGYALPLLRQRHAPLTASLLIAALWAGWHLPLFFLLQSYRDLGPVAAPGLLIGLTCGSIVLTWLTESAAGSILIAAVWHGTYNLTSATQGAHGTVAAVVSTGVMLIAAVVAWRSRRTTTILQPVPLT